ncbi:MAG: hypothetical protein GXP43_00870 [bacterium]|nr:hypothetical protein [bacterium]
MLTQTLNQFGYIFASFWPWFIILFSFFLSGALLFGPLIIRLKKPSFTFGAYLSFTLFSLIVWQLSYLKLLPLNHINLAWAAWLILSLVFYLFLNPVKLSLLRLKSLLKEFTLFSLLLAFWFWVRGFQPDIIGLEKYMDLGFLNSLVKTSYLPVKDMWWIGGSINYYYFGHYLSAVLTLLSSLPTYFTYNLSLATIFAAAFLLIFSVVFNLLSFSFPNLNPKKILALSLLAAVFLNFASNWQTPYGVITAKLHQSTRSFYWYPDATRFIDYRPDSQDKTIHEFPAYSHVVADLHGHLSALPIELALVLLLIIYLFTLPAARFSNIHFIISAIAGALIGALFMTNSWDMMGFALLWGLAIILKYAFSRPPQASFKNFTFSALASLGTFITAVTLFKLHFTPFFKGIGAVRARSPLWMWFLLWGAFLTPVLFNLPWVKKWFKSTQTKILVFSGLFIAVYLLLFPEVFYLKDIYIASFHRANTMFKLTYQAYIILTFLTPFFIVLLAKRRLKLLLYLAILGFTLPLMYPLYSIPGYYGRITPSRWQAGYGWSYLKKQTKGDFQLITFIAKNIKGQPNIVEAVGDGYTQFARVSANTGLPTVLGWPVHEWLWRNQGYGPIGQRRQEIADFYQKNTTLSQKKSFIQKYNIKYIVIGWAERQAYSNLDLDNLLKLGKTVFFDKQTQTYLIKT